MNTEKLQRIANFLQLDKLSLSAYDTNITENTFKKKATFTGRKSIFDSQGQPLGELVYRIRLWADGSIQVDLSNQPLADDLRENFKFLLDLNKTAC